MNRVELVTSDFAKIAIVKRKVALHGMATRCEDQSASPKLIMVERVVGDIDEIVRQVRFDGWQATNAGERLVKQVLRKALFKYKLHADEELFEKAYSYIRQYY